jgi:hypothetical protein
MTKERSIIIGDVHGCIRELDDLLCRVALNAADRLYFVGDLIDRGPDSLAVLRRVRGLLASHPESACIAGNHEAKLLRYRDKGRRLPQWARHADADDWHFLEQLPLVHRLPEFSAILVHGGFFPAFFQHYRRLGEVPRNWRHARGKRARRMRRFLLVRKIDAAGNMVSLHQAGCGLRHWSEAYEGEEGFVFHGHDARPDLAAPLVVGHTMNLDTGCCFGGRLSAAILLPGMNPANAQTVSVPARETYADFFDFDRPS